MLNGIPGYQNGYQNNAYQNGFQNGDYQNDYQDTVPRSDRSDRAYERIQPNENMEPNSLYGDNVYDSISHIDQLRRPPASLPNPYLNS